MPVEEINGTRLNIRVDMAVAGAPWMVFGNSLVTDLSIWDAQVAALSSRWNCLRYDQRGHGGSDVTKAVDFNLLAQDLLAVMDRAGVARAVYAGLSMGVPTGLAACARAPERFRALILIDGQARSAPDAVESWAERIETAQRVGMAEYARITADRWLAGPARAETLAAMIAATGLAGFSAGANALKSYNYSAVLPKISVPSLLMAGAEDGNMPDTMRQMARVIAGARFAPIDHAGHVPCIEQPEAVNVEIAGFLQEIGLAR